MLNHLSLAALGVLLAPLALAQGEIGAREPGTLQDALGLPDGVRIEGSIRPRYEALANPFIAGRMDDDELLNVRTLLSIEADLGPALTLGGELLDSRFILGNESGGAAGEIDTLEPAQLLLSWRPKDVLLTGATLDLAAGRFTMDLGSRRLVARAIYRSILTSFDGARAVWTSPDKLAVTLAYGASTLRAPADATSARENEVALNRRSNTRLGLAHLDAPLPWGLRGELYVLDLDEDDSSNAATRNRDYLTVGARLRQPPARGRFDFELEFAQQSGTARATSNRLDATAIEQDAGMAHAAIGYTFDAPWSPYLSLQYDFASGDRSPADLTSQRFDPLFGDRAFEFGPTALDGFIARTNLASPGIRLEVRPDAESDAYIMARDVRLDSETDSFGNSGVRDLAGLSGDHAGLQIEGRYRRWLVRDALRLTVGAAIVATGGFLETAPNATRQGDPVYGYSELTWTF